MSSSDRDIYLRESIARRGTPGASAEVPGLLPGASRRELVSAVCWLSEALAAYDALVVESEAVRRDRGRWEGWYDLSITGGAVDVQADRLVAWGFWERHDEHEHLVRPVVETEAHDE